MIFPIPPPVSEFVDTVFSADGSIVFSSVSEEVDIFSSVSEEVDILSSVFEEIDVFSSVPEDVMVFSSVLEVPGTTLSITEDVLNTVADSVDVERVSSADVNWVGMVSVVVPIEVTASIDVFVLIIWGFVILFGSVDPAKKVLEIRQIKSVLI